MSAFENTQKINSIEFKKNLHCFCPLGRSWCTYQMTCSIVVGKTIPDYVELEAELQHLDGQTLVIEAAVAKVLDVINEQCHPLCIKVQCYCDDAKHFPVTVEKEVIL